jgi:hypothetical protein
VQGFLVTYDVFKPSSWIYLQIECGVELSVGKMELSNGARVTLFKSTLYNLPIYFYHRGDVNFVWLVRLGVGICCYFLGHVVFRDG